MGSIDKALQTLNLLADAGPQGLMLGEVVDGLGVHKSTAHRTLAALRYRGYATQDPVSGVYRLGPTARSLGSRAADPGELVVALGPALRALCVATDELVHLGIMQGGEVVYLDKVEPARPIRVWSAIGASRPAARTAIGRALLAAGTLDDGVVSAYQAAAGAGPAVDLGAALVAARRRGYATESEENEPGIACVGMALWALGRPVAALSVTAPAERMAPDRMAEVHRLITTVVPPLLPDGFRLDPPA